MFNNWYAAIGLPPAGMTDLQILGFCIASLFMVIYTWKASARKNRNPAERAVWALVFGMPLWVYILFPLMKAIGV